MARSGLRMMPTSPSPSLKFRTAGFPRYGFKASLSGRAFPWTCPERADTSDVGVSPRGGSPNGEEGGGERGTPAATPVVHAEVQGRGHRLGAAGGAVVARDLPRARPE